MADVDFSATIDGECSTDIETLAVTRDLEVSVDGEISVTALILNDWMLLDGISFPAEES